ncbi:MAG: hypothetical protein ACAI38_18230 [Myxococcota bacterium]|nr:hypothetical protein [Myxococcota bacterium]
MRTASSLSAVALSTLLCSVALAQGQGQWRKFDDGRDLAALLEIRNDYVDAQQTHDAAKVSATDDELKHWFNGELREERRESRQARRETRGSWKEVFSEQDYDALRDLSDDKRDQRKQAVERARTGKERKELESLIGKSDDASVNRRVDLINTMLGEARREVARDRRENREDRKEKVEDRRDRAKAKGRNGQ